ncbi:MAG: SEC-C metal-binding domain-containing protein, partial [bacterium]
MKKLGRNERCHCNSGKKYKKCCMEKDEKKIKLKQRVMNITRRDFISGPYKKCPNPECLADNSFGVFISTGGSKTYMRECIVCGYRRNFDLPDIKKKVLYLDQFVISNLIKLLDKDHPSHKRIKLDPFWESLFVKLEIASKSQVIVCPDSFYHKDESLTGSIDFRLMRRLYEHFSSGKTLYPSAIVERNNIVHHFKGWIDGKKVTFDFDPQYISFEQDLHSWSVGLRVTVSSKPFPGQIEKLIESNNSAKNQLQEIWKRWQSDKNVSFI